MKLNCRAVRQNVTHADEPISVYALHTRKRVLRVYDFIRTVDAESETFDVGKTSAL